MSSTVIRILAITPELPTPETPGSMAPGARQLQSLRDQGVDVRVQDMRGIPKLKYLQAIPRMRSQLKDIDLIHAHYGYCGWLGRLQFRRPLVISFMGDDLLGTPDRHGRLRRLSRLEVRANRRVARHATQVIVKSQEMAEVLGGTPCHVIPNGVDLDEFKPMDRITARKRLGWSSHETRILFPGDARNPRKGYALAETALQVAERKLGSPLKMVHLRHIAPDDVALYMNACDAMWMTSLIEGSPNVVKEAMACNLPIVSVPVGDVQELLEDVSGCHVCGRDAEELGQRMVRLLVEKPRVGGRQTLENRSLDIGSVARRIVHVYELALSGRRCEVEPHGTAGESLRSRPPRRGR